MNTKSKVRVTGNDTVVANSLHLVIPGNGIEVTSLNAVNDAAIHDVPKKELTLAKTIGMLVAAPFVGLVYVLALPFIGLYHIVKLALEARAKKRTAGNGRIKNVMVKARNIGLFLAAPFVALGYVIALPVVGFFMISKLAMEARRKGAAAHS